MTQKLTVKNSQFKISPGSSTDTFLIFDCETDGLYDAVTTIHCLVIYDVVRQQTFSYGPDRIADALAHLATADVLIGHNIIFYDIPVIEKLYSSYAFKSTNLSFKSKHIIDTLVCTRLIWPKEVLYELDTEQYPQVPKGLRGSASLKAWGWRLADHKIDFKDFSEYSQEMLEYCMAPHHKVLRDDLRWIECGSINVGDTILGFDEYGPNRKFKAAKVLVKNFDEAELFEVVLESGKVFHVTKEHRWLTSLVRTDGTGYLQGNWVETQNLRTDSSCGSKVPRFFEPWEEDLSKDAGWLAGMFDGEGTISKKRVDFSIAQRPGITLKRLEELLCTKYNKDCVKHVIKKNSDCLSLRFTGNQYSKIEFLGKIRPERLINKFSFDQMGRMEIKSSCLVDRVISVKSIGKGTIVKLTTDSSTFVLDGYPMHNCQQDVAVTKKLYELIQKQNYPEAALKLEHELAVSINKQIRAGIPFDVDACLDLVDDLRAKEKELELQLKEIFPPIKHESIFVPKVNNAKRGYVKGQPFTKVTYQEFNPASRDQIVQRLQEKYGWKPEATTEKGNPILNDDVLETLPYPEAKQLAEYMLIKKRLGQIADGNNAWLKLVTEDCKIHGDVVTNGCITGRASHRTPNMAQVPASYSPYGKECRSLFYAPNNWDLIGIDAKALELRCLAGYLALWDDGEYASIVTNPDIDIHVYNQQMFGVATRDISKRLLYALLYSCGAMKAGTLIDPNEKDETVLRKLGSTAINSFMNGVPALKKLKQQIDEKIATRGYLKGLDGRVLYCRSAFKGLNVLLQASGAAIMKQVVVNVHNNIENSLGLEHGQDWEQLLFIHDEIEVACSPRYTEDIKAEALKAFEEAGEFFNFRCPIEGDAKVGRTWYDVH
jgi:DNA polymerase I